MVYEKDKIRRLIEYKDEIINEQIKNDLEWILGAYNKCFIDKRDYEIDIDNIKKLKKKYYDLEDEKVSLLEQLDLLRRKYRALKKEHIELKRRYRLCCKKLKSMI